MRHGSFVAILLQLVTTVVLAQNTSDPIQFRFFLPSSVRSENVELHYFLYGPFGAHGDFVKRAPNQQLIEFPLAVEGTPASSIKAFAWASGCKIATFDAKADALDIQETYGCQPLGTVSLTGKILDLDFVRQRRGEVRVDFEADWACEFFGLLDCAVPQLQIGIVKPDNEGLFQIDLPDFANDSTSLSSKVPSYFRFVLRDTKTWNPIAFLTPQTGDLRTATGGLRPSSSYEKPVIFVARATK